MFGKHDDFVDDLHTWLLTQVVATRVLLTIRSDALLIRLLHLFQFAMRVTLDEISQLSIQVVVLGAILVEGVADLLMVQMLLQL